MTSCAILFFSPFFYTSFRSSFFLFPPSTVRLRPGWPFLIQTRDRLKGFAQEGYSISSSSISLPPPSPFLLPAPLFSLLELLKTRKSKNREACPTKGDLSFFDPRLSADSMAHYPISLSLSLCPTLHPFFVPRKGPSPSIPSFLLLARFSPFFHHGLLSGVLNPFFPVSCHVTAVYESASQTRGERARAL